MCVALPYHRVKPQCGIIHLRVLAIAFITAAMKSITVHVTDYENTQHTLEALEGWPLMNVIQDHGLPMKAECGGGCACATCHVYVAEEWLSKLAPKTADEELSLEDAVMVQANSRLSCQIILSEAHEGLQVMLAPNP